MIRSLLKLLFLIVLGVLIYNYFLGTPEEKAASKAIFREVKELAVGVKDLIKSEKEKFDAGKYDEAVDKIGNALSKLKSNANQFDKKYLDRIEELEKRKQGLKDALSTYDHTDGRLDKDEGKDKAKKDSMVSELDKLLLDSEQLMNEMEKEE